MTTIATDGKSMAADGQCTAGNTIHGFNTRKVFKLPDGRIVGICGTFHNMAAFIEWMRDGGEKPKLDGDDGFEALVLCLDGTVQSFGTECVAGPAELPAVAGSGSAIALGGMLAGLSPEDAVKLAVERDIYTGGQVIVEHLSALRAVNG